MKINENFLKIKSSYLFSETGRKSREYAAANPDKKVISLGIGDVTRPLAPAVIDAMKKATDDMSQAETFKGYPPEYGYGFLVDLIRENAYESLGVEIGNDEIFVSDGAKSDCGNIGDIFSVDNRVAVCDPVYPVYVDTNIMAGRSGECGSDGKWNNFLYLDCKAENDFLPQIPKEKADLIYLCFPNNPTGTAATRSQLKAWVDYANSNNSVILFDGAYEAYIRNDDIPHSIFEIEGAKTCAIEFRSFSKTAGFTGMRCGYTVIPKELKSEGASVNALWGRRQATKFNGVSYVTQKAAAAVFSNEGKKQVKDTIDYYLNNAGIIKDGLMKAGYKVWGAENSPYIWFEVPEGFTSWEFFDELLNKYQIVGTPGSGFGPSGEGYFRLTGFGSAENTLEAINRLTK